jgi:nucleotide-binding universal stress UspA family protein
MPPCVSTRELSHFPERKTLMYQKILVAYDGSGFSEVALHQAAELARPCKAELHLLGIVVTTGYMALAEGMGGVDVWGMERKKIEAILDNASRELGGQGLNIVTSIREGDPADEIIASAYEIGADLAVLGHSDKGIFLRWFEGSIGAKLLRDLPCSLLIAMSRHPTDT